MAGKGGGAWKVAYADFVTAMMAFFMVMWLTGQKPEVKEAIAEYFRDPFATEPGAAGNDRRTAPRGPRPSGAAREQNRFLGDRGGSPGGRFGGADPHSASAHADAIRATVTFPVASAMLSGEQQDVLRRAINLFAGKSHRIEIRAHCLRQPLAAESPFVDHWELCYARCLVVKRQLEDLGVDPRRLRLSQAEGNEPAAADLSEDELQRNSRVDVILLPEFADLTD